MLNKVKGVLWKRAPAQWSRTARRLIAAITVAVAVLATGAVAMLPAEASCGSPLQTYNICNPWSSGVNMRNAPSASGSSLYLNHGNGVYINCWQHGDTITGPWGTSDIWDFISWSDQYQGQYQGYVSDTYVYTGSNGPPGWLAQCPPGLTGDV
jgi:uncharacterized protein YraI